MSKWLLIAAGLVDNTDGKAVDFSDYSSINH